MRTAPTKAKPLSFRAISPPTKPATSPGSSTKDLNSSRLKTSKRSAASTKCRRANGAALSKLKRRRRLSPSSAAFTAARSPLDITNSGAPLPVEPTAGPPTTANGLKSFSPSPMAEDLQIRVPNLVRNGRDFLDVADCRREEI